MCSKKAPDGQTELLQMATKGKQKWRIPYVCLKGSMYLKLPTSPCLLAFDWSRVFPCPIQICCKFPMLILSLDMYCIYDQNSKPSSVTLSFQYLGIDFFQMIQSDTKVIQIHLSWSSSLQFKADSIWFRADLIQLFMFTCTWFQMFWLSIVDLSFWAGIKSSILLVLLH